LKPRAEGTTAAPWLVPRLENARAGMPSWSPIIMPVADANVSPPAAAACSPGRLGCSGWAWAPVSSLGTSPALGISPALGAGATIGGAAGGRAGGRQLGGG
jgi:hypothetical protein